jgi:hypothetical protein
MRMAAQHLHRPRRLSAAEMVALLTGVQAQVLSSGGLALGARTDGLTARDVERARVADRSIVHTWAMRGTLHLIATEDFGWLVPLVIEPGIANAHRRLKQEGVPADQPARAVRLIERMLGREGSLTRAEIAQRLSREGIRTEGQAIAHLMWLAAALGVVCFGPDRGRRQCFVLVRDWVGEPRSMDRDAALIELAIRYLRAHGPAEPADLAFWSGIRPGDANRAWRAIENHLEPVKTAASTLWKLRSAEAPAPAGLVRLLPSFDEYLLGWKRRDLLAPPEHWVKVNRGGGWLHPIVLVDGRAVATWRREAKVTVNPFNSLPPAVTRGIAREEARMTSFLETSLPPSGGGSGWGA